jgi:hypothetical protein
MPSAAGTDSRKDTATSGDELSKRLDRLEELVHSIFGDLCDVKQQQQGLGVAVLRLEKNSTGVCDGSPVNNPAASAAGANSGHGGESLVRLSGAHGCPPHNPRWHGPDTDTAPLTKLL